MFLYMHCVHVYVLAQESALVCCACTSIHCACNRVLTYMHMLHVCKCVHVDALLHMCTRHTAYKFTDIPQHTYVIDSAW